MSAPLTEAQIIAGCRASDRRAQEVLFAAYYGEFLKVCLRYAQDAQEAEALLSDAFFKIFTRISTYSGAGSFEGWMRQIVVNTCLSAVRTRIGRRAVIVHTHDGEAPIEGIDTHAHNEAVSNLGFEELLRLIGRLPATSRAVFNLYVFDGFSHREIAAQLNISEGTSHWHLSTARQWLKQNLQATRHG